MHRLATLSGAPSILCEEYTSCSLLDRIFGQFKSHSTSLVLELRIHLGEKRLLRDVTNKKSQEIQANSPSILNLE